MRVSTVKSERMSYYVLGFQEIDQTQVAVCVAPMPSTSLPSASPIAVRPSLSAAELL